MADAIHRFIEQLVLGKAELMQAKASQPQTRCFSDLQAARFEEEGFTGDPEEEEVTAS